MLLNDIFINHIKSKRKSMTLSVDAGGKVVLRTPHYISKRDLERFILSQEQWLTTRVSEAKRNCKVYTFQIGSDIPFCGNNLQLTTTEQNKKIIIADNRLLIPSTDNIKSQLLKWYKEMARVEISELVEHYTSILGISYNRIFIRSQKTRWGSCSGKRNLNFNWKIILTSPELIRYLVIHEVSHLIEMNHSKDFWDIVKTYDPLYQHHRKELQKAGYYLTTFLE